jgi:hypothetical protein
MASRMNDHSDSVGTGVVVVTARLALAGLALFPPLVCRAPAGIVSTYVPAAAAVTSTPIAQDTGGIVLAAVKVTVDPPAGAETVPAPQLLLIFGTVATCSPLGNVSVNAADREIALALGLLNVMVSLEISFIAMVVGLNAFVMVGGVVTTGCNATVACPQ